MICMLLITIPLAKTISYSNRLTMDCSTTHIKITFLIAFKIILISLEITDDEISVNTNFIIHYITLTLVGKQKKQF